MLELLPSLLLTRERSCAGNVALDVLLHPRFELLSLYVIENSLQGHLLVLSLRLLPRGFLEQVRAVHPQVLHRRVGCHAKGSSAREEEAVRDGRVGAVQVDGTVQRLEGHLLWWW